MSAFDGTLTGKIPAIVPNRMIVQSWRAEHWKKTDLDSILLLTFSRAKRAAQIDLVPANMPEHDHDGIDRGWKKYWLFRLSSRWRGSRRGFPVERIGGAVWPLPSAGGGSAPSRRPSGSRRGSPRRHT